MPKKLLKLKKKNPKIKSDLKVCGTVYAKKFVECEEKVGDLFVDVALNGRVLANPNCLLTKVQQGVIDLNIAPIYDYFASNFEPCLAVNPTDLNNIIITTHVSKLRQDTPIFYTLDGGKTWNWVEIPASRCMQTIVDGATNDFGSSSDPWVTFDKNGNVYASFVCANLLYRANGSVLSAVNQGVLIFKSTDKGQSWNAPNRVVNLIGNDVPDKPGIFGSTFKPNLVYLTYHDQFQTVTTFQRSTDGANFFDPPIVFTYSDVSYPIVFIWGASVTTLSTGMVLLSVRNSIFDTSLDTGYGPGHNEQIYINRSTNDGQTFGPTIVALPDATDCVAWDPINVYIVRDTSTWHDIAINKCKDYIYIVTQDSSFYTGPSDNDGFEFLGAGSVIIMSKDQGVTWTQKIPINPTSLDKQAYMATVAVLDNGIVCVSYYTDRNQNHVGDNGTGPLNTDVYLSLFDKNLNYIGERRITEISFDLRKSNTARFIGYNSYNIGGDYLKCGSAGNDFVVPLSIANNAQVGTFPRPATVLVHTIVKDSQYTKFARVSLDDCNCHSECQIPHVNMVGMQSKKEIKLSTTITHLLNLSREEILLERKDRSKSK